MEKLRIEQAEIIFANLVDNGFGTSLTIKVTDVIEKQVADFWAANKIGNEKTIIGVANFKEYEGTKQLNLKINEQTKFAGLNGLTTDALGFGAKVNMFVNAFPYKNKFTKGLEFIGASVSAVVILSGRKTGADADLAELLGDSSTEAWVEKSENEVAVADKKTSSLPF